MDIESAFIVMLCTLNTVSSLKNTHDPISSKDLFKTNNLSWDEADLDASKIVL